MNLIQKETTKIIAHRGDSGNFPEHSIEAYESALESGAWAIEPDLVLSKDGVLVCRHEPMLSHSTNIAQLAEFKDRKRKGLVDGKEFEDWFCFDFTFEELQKIHPIQRYEDRGLFQSRKGILSFEEALNLFMEASIQKNKPFSVVVELKHAYMFNEMGYPMEDLLLKTLQITGWDHFPERVFVESFEVKCLQKISASSPYFTMQLIDADYLDDNGFPVLNPNYLRPYDLEKSGDPRTFLDLITDEGLEFISTYAKGVGLWKYYLVGQKKVENNWIVFQSGVAERIRKKNLKLFVFTIRDEKRFRLEAFSTKQEELFALLELKPCAIFCDFPQTGVDNLEAFLQSSKSS